jgi:hypothetical protein
MHDLLLYFYIFLSVVVLLYMYSHDEPPSFLKPAWMKEADRLAYEQAMIDYQEDREYLRFWRAETVGLREARKEQLRRLRDSPMLSDQAVVLPPATAQSPQSPTISSIRLPEAIDDIHTQSVSATFSGERGEEDGDDDDDDDDDDKIFVVRPSQNAATTRVRKVNRVFPPRIPVADFFVQNNTWFQDYDGEPKSPHRFNMFLDELHRRTPPQSLPSTLFSSRKSSPSFTGHSSRFSRYEPETHKVLVNLPPSQRRNRKNIKELFRHRQENLSEEATTFVTPGLASESLQRIRSEPETVGKKPSMKEKWKDLRYMLKKDIFGRKERTTLGANLELVQVGSSEQPFWAVWGRVSDPANMTRRFWKLNRSNERLP